MVLPTWMASWGIVHGIGIDTPLIHTGQLLTLLRSSSSRASWLWLLPCLDSGLLSIGLRRQSFSIHQRSPTVAGHYKCAAALAFQYGFGNTGGLIAPNIYLSSQAPGYPQGFGVSLALLLLGGFMCCVFFVGIKTENRKRDGGFRDWRLDLLVGGKENLGSDYPGFRFVT